MEILNGLRNLDFTEGKYYGFKALIAYNSSKVVHLVKSFHVTSVINYKLGITNFELVIFAVKNRDRLIDKAISV